MSVGMCRQKTPVVQEPVRLDTCSFPECSTELRSFIPKETCSPTALFNRLPKEIVDRLDTQVRDLIHGAIELKFEPGDRKAKIPAQIPSGDAPATVTRLLNVLRRAQEIPLIPVSGKYTAVEQGEILKLQKAVGLPADGVVNSNTFESLTELALATNQSTARGALMGREFMWRLVKKASQNPLMVRDKSAKAMKEVEDYTLEESIRDPLALEPPAGAKDARGRTLAPAVDPALMMSIIQSESAFDYIACSKVGAQGLTQLMPETSRRHGVVDPFNIVQNVYGGARVVRHLAGKYNGDQALVAAAYNAGEGRVDEMLKKIVEARSAQVPSPLSEPEKKPSEPSATTPPTREAKLGPGASIQATASDSDPTLRPTGQDLLKSGLLVPETQAYVESVARNYGGYHRELQQMEAAARKHSPPQPHTLASHKHPHHRGR